MNSAAGFATCGASLETTICGSVGVGTFATAGAGFAATA